MIKAKTNKKFLLFSSGLSCILLRTESCFQICFRTSFQSPVAQPNDYRLYNYANMVTGGTPTSWYFSSNPLQSITYEVDNAPLIWMINQLQDQQNLLSVNALTLSTTSAPTTPKLFTDFIQVEANKKIYGLSSTIKDMPLDYKNNPKPVPCL